MSLSSYHTVKPLISGVSERIDVTETVPANIIQTWQTSTLDGHGANLALDPDTNTCAKTEEQDDLRWRVDLGGTHVITGVFVDAGKSEILIIFQSLPERLDWKNLCRSSEVQISLNQIIKAKKLSQYRLLLLGSCKISSGQSR